MKQLLTEKNLQRLKTTYEANKKAFWIGGVGALALLWMFNPSADEGHIIFQKEPSLDFKNADILGNQRQSILQGQESLFAKTQKSVLESQSQLKSEVALLKGQLADLKSQVSPQPSPGPSIGLSSLTDPKSEVYGPMPAGSTPPDPTLGPPVAGIQPGTVRNSSRTSGLKDSVSLSQAAPSRTSRESLGLETPAPKAKKPGPAMISFPVKTTGKAYLAKPGIKLPSGSYVKATMLTGVEAPEGKTYPVLLQLDYAYIIPNDKRLDLAGCFMIAKAQGDLSTERVQMQATKLSCVSKRGGMFEREVNGFVADDVDNSFAVIGRVNSKQDRVAATAFLSSIVAGIGKAIQQAQTTQQVTPLGGSQTVLTGDQTKFIAAGGAADAASLVTQWYLKQAQNLLPTINVGSGQNVWVVMQDQVDLPKDYFNQNGVSNPVGGPQNASIYSYFTRVAD